MNIVVFMTILKDFFDSKLLEGELINNSIVNIQNVILIIVLKTENIEIMDEKVKNLVKILNEQSIIQN